MIAADQIPFIDIHTHTWVHRSDVTSIQNIIVGRDEFADRGIYSAGLHPRYLGKPADELMRQLADLSRKKNIIAIGECGLDTLSEYPQKLQEKLFSRQVELARLCCKPLVIHCVRSAERLVHLLRELEPKVPVIIHGFNNNERVCKLFLDNGMYLSFGKALLKEGSNAFRQIRCLPLSSLFLETDDSDRTIEEIYSIAASGTGKTVEELKNIIYKNYQTIFYERS